MKQQFPIQILIVILLIQCQPAMSDPLFSKEQVTEDIDYMIKMMEETHPNLFYHMPRSEFMDRKNELLNNVGGQISRKEMCRLFMPLIASLRDGHTSMRLPEIDLMTYVRYMGTFFPSTVLINDGKLYIHRTLRDTIQSGAEIISIQDKPVTDIIEEIRPYVSGEKDFYKDRIAAERFPAFYWLLYESPGEYKIEFRMLEDNRNQTLILRGLTSQELESLGGKTEGNNIVRYEYMQLDEATGLIDFRSFSQREEFKTFLEETFSEIRSSGIENLIIDIRENGGGNSSLGDDLFNYITDQPYKQVDKMLVKLSDKVIEDGWGKWLPADTLEFYRGKVYIQEFEMDVPQNNDLLFTGDVYLLTGPNSFSSANMFASAFRCYNMGTIVGEETGGLIVSYGDVRSFRMPNTNIPFGCSFKMFHEACGKADGKGVLPHHEIKSSPTDTDDPVLKFTLELIRERKEKI